MDLRVRRCLVLGTLMSLVLSGCIPRRQLSVAEKQADLHWVYSKFGESYAPLQYKENLVGFSYEQLKQDYLDRAAKTKSNDEFYQLVHEFVAHFQDAHTSASFSAEPIPGRTKVAYLGFFGKRKGDDLVVEWFLPTSRGMSNYPVKVGDTISTFDGLSLKDYVKANFSPRRNLGQEEANTTLGAHMVTFRFAYDAPLPSAKVLRLGIKRNDSVQEVEVPWLVRDYAAFVQDYMAAIEASAKVDTEEKNNDTKNHLTYLKNIGNLALGRIDRLPAKAQKVAKLMMQHKDLFEGRRFDSFVHLDTTNPFQSQFLKTLLAGNSSDPFSKCESLEDRAPFDLAYSVPGSCDFPALLLRLNDQGQPDFKGTTLAGYIRVPSFMGGGLGSNPVEEFKNTLSYLQGRGVEKILIDTIDNGGGSLYLGMAMAQALSSKPLDLPSIRFRTNDSWLDTFQGAASSSQDTDIERHLYQSVFDELTADREAGQILSRPFPADSLFPYTFSPSTSTQPLKVVLLVNEMCASMCDIFAGILQDNHLATVVGSRTMGAGGNVTNHFMAPNSNLVLSQTESLIVRSNGNYIENVGVSPDVEFPVNQHSDTKYDAVVRAGFAQLLK